ncbi:MAG: hypothetical protein MI864_15950 [Pseudomonadales bacterium]|nr:hypothetical protein [Pseudomonadales bacterium]
MKLTCITSTKPNSLTKRYFLDGNGQPTCKTAANMVAGVAEVKELSSIGDFANLLQNLGHHQALCFGIPEVNTPVNVVSKERFKELGNPANNITRSNECFYWPEGRGILLINYDPPKCSEPLTREELICELNKVLPMLSATAYIWWCSSSSNIVNTHTQKRVNGLKGQRVYIVVQDAGDIPRAGKVLTDRLWLAGKGYIVVGAAGQKLERCLVDANVWQPARLDFASGAECFPPLEQKRGAPIVHEGESLDTQTHLPDLTPEEKRQLDKLKQEVKRAKDSAAAGAKQAYIEARANEIAGGDDQNLDEARSSVRKALESNVLTGDFPIFLSSGKKVTVGEVLDDPASYHLALTRDPIEPEYCGDKIVGKLYLIGARPNLHSFCHGGKNYRLVRQARRIELVRGRTHDAVLETLELMRQLPDIFDYGQTLVAVSDGKLTTFSEPLLLHYLGGIAQYFSTRKIGERFVETLEDPSVKIVRPLLAMKRYLKPLEAVISAPVVMPDGTLINKSGYHEQSRLFLDTQQSLPNIAETPTIEQVREAVKYLWQPFSQFPFAESLDRSVFFGALLSACLRPVLPTCPAFAFDAPIQGSGKTLLAQCVASLSTGEMPTVWPHTTGRDDEETRKRLFTALRSGERAIIWDNVLGVLASASLAACLTSPQFTDRILGQSQEVTVPNKTLILLTGNNLSLAGDMPRRVMISRIDPATDTPYKREFELCPLSYTLTNRQKMVSAALTIVKGWLSSPDSRQGERAPGKMASFEVWDDMVRQPIAWLGRVVFPDKYQDVIKAIDDAQNSDPEQEALADLLNSLRELFGGNPFAAKDLIMSSRDFSAKHSHIESALQEIAPNINHTNPKSIGRVLQYRRDRIVGGLVLKGKKTKDRWLFKVENLTLNNSRNHPVIEPILGVKHPNAN